MTEDEMLQMACDDFFNRCLTKVQFQSKKKNRKLTRDEIAEIVSQRHASTKEEFAEEGIEIPELKLQEFKVRLSGLGARITKGGSGFTVSGQRVKSWLRNSERNWPLWDSYKKYLNSRAISEDVLDKTEESIDQALDLLGDPNILGLRKGLVMGNVQAGKTMHFIGLLNKAVDAGYHTIIVLGGHLNELRTQTQERIEEGLARNANEDIGRTVTLFDTSHEISARRPLSWTTIEQDLNSRTANNHFHSDLEKQPVVLIIKKNVSILKFAIELLSKKRGLDKPMLLIDDEADYASINTKHAKSEYASTNEQIRNLLNLFERRAYVAYTATPFANVFIPFLNTTSGTKDDDLFPTDFMLKMPVPNNYVGHDYFFPSEENSDSKPPIILIEHITETEGWLPLKHKKDHKIDSLDWQLIEAVDLFLLVIAIRYLRGAVSDHNTMMVNVSRFNDVQFDVAFEIEEYISYLSNSLKHFGKLYQEGTKSASKKIEEVENLYLREFSDIEFKFNDVLEILIKYSKKVEVELVNGSKTRATLSRGSLDYKSRKENGYWVIAVGGLKLSRGLTLENLSVTYFLRNALAYDTLTQMCRWFGYRPGYRDLCRLYLTPDSQDHYVSVTKAIENLYRQLNTMSLLKLTPRELGLRIAKSDPVLLVTAKNKLGEGKEIDYNINMSANSFGGFRPYIDINKSRENLKLFQNFIDELGKLKLFERAGITNPSIRILEKVPYSEIINFLSNLKLSPNKIRIQNFLEILRKLENAKAKKPRVMIFSRNKLDGNNLRKYLDPNESNMITPITIIDKFDVNPIVKTMKVRGDYLYVPSTIVSDGDDLRHSFTEEENNCFLDILSRTIDKPNNSHYRELIEEPVLIIHLVYPIKKLGKDGSGELPLQDTPATLFDFHMPSFNHLNKDSKFPIRIEDLEERGVYIENEVFRGVTLDDATDEEQILDE